MTRNENYERIAVIIKYLVENFRKQPSLDELAKIAGLNPSYFQKLFTEWAGVSPKQFLAFLTVESLKKEIASTRSIIEAGENVGLSSQSRAYDLMVNIEAITPGEYKTHGKNLHIEHGFACTPFGKCFVAKTTRGVCCFDFVDDNEDETVANFKNKWPNARHIRNDKTAEAVVEQIFSDKNKKPLNVCLKGTPFQIKVWQALLSIPFGTLATYTDVARLAGNESAVRAAASAVASNPVTLIIPCHRVIRNEGVIGQYHWGSARKASIIGWEKAQILIDNI